MELGLGGALGGSFGPALNAYTDYGGRELS